MIRAIVLLPLPLCPTRLTMCGGSVPSVNDGRMDRRQEAGRRAAGVEALLHVSQLDVLGLPRTSAVCPSPGSLESRLCEPGRV